MVLPIHSTSAVLWSPDTQSPPTYTKASTSSFIHGSLPHCPTRCVRTVVIPVPSTHPPRLFASHRRNFLLSIATFTSLDHGLSCIGSPDTHRALLPPTAPYKRRPLPPPAVAPLLTRRTPISPRYISSQLSPLSHDRQISKPDIGSILDTRSNLSRIALSFRL